MFGYIKRLDHTSSMAWLLIYMSAPTWYRQQVALIRPPGMAVGSMGGKTAMKTATSRKETVVNGVNVQELFKTIDEVKKKATIAKFRFRADNTWINGGHNRTSIRDFYGAGGEDTSRKIPFIL